VAGRDCESHIALLDELYNTRFPSLCNINVYPFCADLKQAPLGPLLFS